MSKRRKVLVSEELLKLLSEGRAKYVGQKIKLGRWVLREMKGVFIGRESKTKS